MITKKIFGTEGTICPEGNRWLANIPEFILKK